MAISFVSSCPQIFALTAFLALPSVSSAQDAAPSPEPAASRCGTVSVARLNWASAAIISHIDAFVLEHGYGCDVELVPGDTISTLESMIADREPDISPETWINSARETLDEAVARRQLHYMAPAFADGGIEGWWIPQYVAEANPDIRTIADALARADLFPSGSDDGKAAIHNCPKGWSCEITTRNLFRAYRAEERGFELVDAPTGEDLEASIAAAFEARSGWLGYYWAPTAALGRFDMVKLNFDAAYDEQLWNTCMIDPSCPAPQVTAWPRSEVYTVVTDDFARRGAATLAYLRNRSFGNHTLNQLLAWKADNEASSEATALRFLDNGEDIWSEWVSPDVARKVGAALAER
jgi:glycine betaine/proline transport system substrate-binding protein